MDTLRLNGSIALRIVLASPDGEPAEPTIATTGSRSWRRKPGESVDAFVARISAEAPRPALVVAWGET